MLKMINSQKQIKNQKIPGVIMILSAIFLLIFILIVFFLIKSNYNFSKTGHNMSNKKLKEIEEYILNISSYKAKADVTITSNKTTNKYIIEQECTAEKIKQTIVEPENIKGLEIIYENNTLTLNNTKLNLSKVYENYQYITNNYLDLITFIEEYRECKLKIENEKSKNTIKTYEENGMYRFEIEINENQGNKYIANKKLTIDKNTGKILSLEVEDKNQKELVYILYSEIEIR